MTLMPMLTLMLTTTMTIEDEGNDDVGNRYWKRKHVNTVALLTHLMQMMTKTVSRKQQRK